MHTHSTLIASCSNLKPRSILGSFAPANFPPPSAALPCLGRTHLTPAPRPAASDYGRRLSSYGSDRRLSSYGRRSMLSDEAAWLEEPDLADDFEDFESVGSERHLSSYGSERRLSSYGRRLSSYGGERRLSSYGRRLSSYGGERRLSSYGRRMQSDEDAMAEAMEEAW